MKLNGNTLIQILPLQDLYTDYYWHKRLMVFAQKGRVCVNCGRVGVLLLITVDNGGRKHVDLYTDDFVLMTVDHTVPKKIGRELGWPTQAIESLDNKECMCSPCNGGKGCSLETKRKETPPRRTGVEVIRQLVFNENIFSRELV